MTKARLATVWLDGCSGCHMSLLDMDEKILDIAKVADLVCSPLVDTKEFPEGVDVTLVEGAVSSEEDLHKIHRIRKNTRVLVALGDCAVTGNVAAMRNAFGVRAVLDRSYRLTSVPAGSPPDQIVPRLLPRVRPIHEVVHVDLTVPGCPPSAQVIYHVVTELLAGRTPDVTELTRFGA
jgi:NAD-reducing hydrogenase small subunit